MISQRYRRKASMLWIMQGGVCPVCHTELELGEGMISHKVAWKDGGGGCLSNLHVIHVTCGAPRPPRQVGWTEKCSECREANDSRFGTKCSRCRALSDRGLNDRICQKANCVECQATIKEFLNDYGHLLPKNKGGRPKGQRRISTRNTWWKRLR